MKLRSFSKSIAVVSAASMVVTSPLMAMAAGSPVPFGTTEDVEVETDAAGNVTELKVKKDDGQVDTSFTNKAIGVQTKDAEGNVKTVFYVMVEGEWDADFDSINPATGAATLVEFDGAKFFGLGGTLRSDLNGTVNTGSEAYFCSLGRVCTEYTGLAEYNGAWFYVVEGNVDLSYVGIVEWANGDETGSFLVTNGQLRTDYTGFITLAGTTYHIVKGQVYGDGTVTDKDESGVTVTKTVVAGIAQ